MKQKQIFFIFSLIIICSAFFIQCSSSSNQEDLNQAPNISAQYLSPSDFSNIIFMSQEFESDWVGDEYTSVAIDSNDKVHFIFYDSYRNYLKYATNESGSWSIQTVSVNSPLYASLALDSSNTPHISYYKPSGTELRYTYLSSGTWYTQTIDSSGTVGEYSSIAIDSDDNVHISYYSGGGYLKYATNESGSWSTETVDTSTSVGKYTSIVTDTRSPKRVHISYYDDYSNNLKYASKIIGGSSWTIETVDSSTSNGKYSSITVDSNNIVNISYYDENNGYLKHATRIVSNWIKEVVDSSADVGQYSSLVFDSSDNLNISYYDSDNESLKYAIKQKNTSTWEIGTVESSSNQGIATSLAIDSEDNMHITYVNSDNMSVIWTKAIVLQITKVSVGNNFSCALTDKGGIFCWGSNNRGQLGNGTTTDSSVPVQVEDIDGITNTAIDLFTHTSQACAILDTGALQCWGNNHSGQLGDGTTTDATSPVNVTGIDGTSNSATDVAMINNTTCAILDTGALKCWGGNSAGQLGNGTTTDSSVPVAVTDIDGSTHSATSVSLAAYHSCALLDTGGVQCWGNNNYGRLGDGTATSSSIPVDVTDIDGITNTAIQLKTSLYHSCVILDTGGMQCWGNNNDGQLGDGTQTDAISPVDVTDIDGTTNTATTFDLGWYNTFAVLDTGAIQSWGLNNYGVLGDGTTTDSTTPVDVVDIDGTTNVATDIIMQEYSVACALLDTGGMQCWGLNADGTLGDGTTTNSSIPVDVVGIDGIENIADHFDLENFHNCAVLDSGKVQCWGDNSYGQLGNGNTTDSSEPVERA